MVRHSFSALSKAGFINLYCAIGRPHLEYTMEANTLKLGADIGYLNEVQRLVARLVRGFGHVSYAEGLHQLHISLKRRCGCQRVGMLGLVSRLSTS